MFGKLDPISPAFSLSESSVFGGNALWISNIEKYWKEPQGYDPQILTSVIFTKWNFNFMILLSVTTELQKFSDQLHFTFLTAQLISRPQF